jgi:alpha-L-rhamnosidase
LILLAAAQGCTSVHPEPTGSLIPTRLCCEHLKDPLCIDEAEPRLSWALGAADPEARGLAQTAYRVLVAGSAERLEAGEADLWDSGRVESDRQLQIALDQIELRSGQRCYWKVRVWDQEGRPSPWSRTAFFEMGLLSDGDWKGTWIGDGKPAPEKDEEFYSDDPAPLFRKAFILKKPVRSARLYLSGLGYYEAYLNGRRVGDHVLDPGWTTYSQRVLYSAYDVTDLLRNGANALGIIVGSGWYDPLPLRMWGWLNLRDHLVTGRPATLVQLNIEYTDGTGESIATDETWKKGVSPIVRNNVYLGEVYDARLEVPGWSEPRFDDRRWTPAVKVTGPPGALRAQMQPPVKAMPDLMPVNRSSPSEGVYIFDMGRNLAGWVRLRVKGPAGTKVALRYGELLHPDGTLNGMTGVCGQIKGPGRGGPGAPDVAYQEDVYILDGEGEEVYTPRFTFHAFRYVEVTGYPGIPSLEAVVAVPLCAAVKRAGTFACSHPLFNEIQEMVLRTFRSNLFSVQSDCPGREKFGYGGDIVATSEAHLLNFDMAAFYTKTVRDFGDAAVHTGALTETAPYVGIPRNGGAAPPGWAVAHPLLQEQLFRYYGSRRTLEEQYGTGRQWLERLESRAVDGILDEGISDHESLVSRPVPVTGTSFYYQNAKLMSRLAGLTGRQEDEKRYALLAEEIKTAFIDAFVAATGEVYTATQACQAAALFFDLLPPDKRDAALKVLIDRIEGEDKGHLSTGIFGTRYLLRVLSDAGRADVASSIVNQETYPGWGHMLENGATTLWEHWAFSDSTYSHNHPMFGVVSEWFYRTVGGLCPAPEAEGFDKIFIRPKPVAGLTWASTSYASVRGTVAVHWRVEKGRFILEITVPPNTSALVHVPTADPDAVKEGAVPAEQAMGVSVIREVPGAVVYGISSGFYCFSAPSV